jgi:hypothetical protein
MASDYEAITADNIRRRGTDFDDIGEFLSAQFYSDRAHFIFELLQNAEDALKRRDKQQSKRGNGKVTFELFPDRLEFSHFGQPFDANDVRGVCDVLHGTKKDDLTQIGKFGIGFKSVYTITSSPKIYSGDEHFEIERYIRPHAIPPLISATPGETRFIFPFNHKTLRDEEIYTLIDKKLSSLGPRVLLFLKHIHQIEWFSNGVRIKSYKKTSGSAGQFPAEWLSLNTEDGENSDNEKWLKLTRSIDALGNRADVEIAYQFVTDLKTTAEIIPIEDAKLIVFFPTEKETHLNFLIQGPYRTTPARDNISLEDEWNQTLLNETAQLVAESLPILRDMGLMNVGLLQALPIRVKDFPERSISRAIFTSVRKALREQELLPTSQKGKYVKGSDAKLARGSELQALVDIQQLQKLFATPQAMWLTDGITTDRTPELRNYLMREIDVNEIDPSRFARALSLEFISYQSDDWLIRFYKYLDGQESLWKHQYRTDRPILREKQFIRLEGDDHSFPFKADGTPAVFLPSEVGSEYPTVKKSIVEDTDVLNFLKSLGLTEPDIVDEVISFVLPRYHPDNPLLSNDKQHIDDIKKLLRALSHASSERKRKLMEAYAKTAFVRGFNAASKQLKLCIPSNVYLNTPNLAVFLDGNPDVYFLDEKFYEKSARDMISFGILTDFNIKRRALAYYGEYVNLESWHSHHKRGVNGFDPSAEIAGLDYAVAHPTLERAKVIWNVLLPPCSNLIRGVVEFSTRHNFLNASKESMLSPTIGKLVIENKWIPDKSGNFHTPCELTLDDLPEGFDRNENLAKQLDMKMPTATIQALAVEQGIEIEDIELLLGALKSIPNEARDTLHRLMKKNEAKGKKSVPSFSDELIENFSRPATATHVGEENPGPEPLHNPDFRRERTGQEIERAIASEPGEAERVRTVLRTRWEDKNPQTRQFLLEQYAGKCQICNQTFPKRNGQPYFEGLYLVTHTLQGWVDRPGNVLCLCPTCCAKFQHGAVEATANIIEQIKSLQMAAEGGDSVLGVSVNLCGNDVWIRFSERHLIDLQEMVNISGGDPFEDSI